MRRSLGRRGNNNSGGISGGPLMTGHLQDIEMQLELLKRKREMIEQQQQLLVMEQQFKNSATRHSYDQMRYDEPNHHGSNRDFSHLYDTGSKHRSQFGRKRQADPQWQYDGAPKRITPKKKNPNQSQFNQHGSGNVGSGHFRNQRPYQNQGPSQGSKPTPKPLMDLKVPKQSINQKASSKPRKYYPPLKVSKPKAPAASNKLASHTESERKSLVTAATEASSDGDVSRMLLPDQVPSQQVSGRLELALGAIMKNIRTLIDGKPEHATMLRSIQLQRVMKQAVRERIRTVMLGKVVGSLLEILAIYREEFPEETDADILNIGLEAGGVVASEPNHKFIESDDPGEFFKVNMNSLLDQKLKEMFSKLDDIYANAEETPSEEPVDLQKKDEEKTEEKKEEDIQEYKDFLNSTMKVVHVKRMLPRLLKRYIPYVIKILNVDSMYQTTKAAVTMKANQKAANIFSAKGPEKAKGDANASAAETPKEKRQLYNLPYYVKIMGRPTLPKRKVMQGFLSQFNAKSIKKHRTIHNLLFVGFTEKSDFDVMVGADGTVIGKSTLSVRICSKGNNDGSNDESLVEAKQEQQNDSDIISSDLDGQITDLLSSIRKSEEEDTTKKENGEEASEETTNVDGGENQQSGNEETGNNSDTVKTEQVEGEVQNDEEMNDETQEEGDEIMNEENTDEIVTEENTDEVANEENTDEVENEENTDEANEENNLDNNTASQEEDIADAQDSELPDDSEAQNTEITDEAETENPEVSNGTEKPEETEISENAQESNEGEAQNTEPNGTTPANSEPQSGDKVGELKASGRSTPSRMSARLANVTPSSIRTRRASRLASQN